MMLVLVVMSGCADEGASEPACEARQISNITL
jgi:hypothetical protein